MSKLNLITRRITQILISSLSMVTISDRVLTGVSLSTYMVLSILGTMSIFMILLSQEGNVTHTKK